MRSKLFFLTSGVWEYNIVFDKEMCDNYKSNYTYYHSEHNCLEHANIFTSCDAAVHPLASVVLCSYRLYGFNFLTSLHELTFIPNSIAIQISWPVSKKKEIFQNLFATLDFKRDILHNSTVLCFELIQMQAKLFIYERQGKDRPLVTSHMIATVTTWEQRILQSCKL